MVEQIVLVSHCLRGARCSPERMADLRAARAALRRLRTNPPEEYENATFTMPYLLYGETTEDVVGARIRSEAGYGLMPHSEVLVVGEALCEGVCAESVRACAKGQKVAYEKGLLLRSAA